MAITEGITGLGGSLGGVVNPDLTLAVGGSPTVGRQLIVFVSLQDTTATVSSLNDDCGIATWSQRGDVTASGVREQCWSSSPVASAGGSFIKLNFTKSILASGTLSEWAGIAAFGTFSSSTGSTANPSIALTTQDANNYVAAGFASVGGTTATSGTGTLDRSISSGGGSPVVSSLTNNTSAGAGSVTNSITLAATTWIAMALELRSTIPAGSTRPNLTLMGIGS